VSELDRRKFLKVAGGCAVAAVAAAATPARAEVRSGRETPGLLIDTTLCVGCRACEVACTEVNDQRAPDKCGDPTVFDQTRPLDVDRFTVVNRAPEPGRDGEARFAKTQCMHCIEPACASACLTRALEKTPEGPIVYHKDRCMGCRYCMVACPFEVPRFEYASATPTIKKCELCFGRQKDGKSLACAQVCPTGALTFGRRNELLLAAKQRVYAQPDRYVQHVYGEREAGGTAVLYISDVSFDKLGLPTGLGERPWTDLTKGALGAVPFIMALWPPLLMGIHSVTRRRTNGHGPNSTPTDEEVHHG
jgi:formate dehydrogenase iron-sulfur subunit